MRCYIATKISNREAGIMLAYKLASRGVKVTSRWLECEKETRPAEREGPQWEEFAREWGRNDMEDVRGSDTVVFLSVPDGMRGTWVEFGLALALNKNIHWIGGRNQTVFTWLDYAIGGRPIQYHDSVESFLCSIDLEVEMERTAERKAGPRVLRKGRK